MKNVTINLALTVASAVLLLLSTAGFGISYLVFVAFIPFLYSIDRGGVNPLLSGWLFGFLYFFVGLFWMITTFNFFGGAPLPAAYGILLFISLSGGFVCFAPFAYVAKKYHSQPLIIAMVFVALEIIKSNLFFTGVPWLNLAQSQYKNILILQSVSVFGEFGLSFLIILINLLLYYIIIKQDKKFYVAITAIVVIIMLTPGVIRTVAPIKIDDHKEVIVYQTGYKQEDKWNNTKRYDIINDLNIKLTQLDRKDKALLLLPESTYPARALDTPFIMDVINNISFDVPVLLGSDRTETVDNKTSLYNSMALINNGQIVDTYEKMHLTPFGEYFPLQTILNPVKEFFFGPGDMFTAGTTPTMFEAGDLKIAPLICYETGFSNLLNYPISQGANIIAMISNDAWFGNLSGKTQHLAIDVMRTAEFGKTALRSTQDGISAVILPNGVIAESIAEPVAHAIIYDAPIVNGRTIYSYIGNLWILFVIIGAYYILNRTRRLAENKI